MGKKIERSEMVNTERAICRNWNDEHGRVRNKKKTRIDYRLYAVGCVVHLCNRKSKFLISKLNSHAFFHNIEWFSTVPG